MAHVYPHAYRNDVAAEDRYSISPIARTIEIIGGAIMALLALRFVLVLLGASPANQIANWVYTWSEPFVRPFFSLFNYTPVVGIGRFEFETLIAIAAYAILTGLLSRLFGGRRYE
jgi:YggT family protein